jgi:hypothetical protein
MLDTSFVFAPFQALDVLWPATVVSFRIDVGKESEELLLGQSIKRLCQQPGRVAVFQSAPAQPLPSAADSVFNVSPVEAPIKAV